MIYVENNVINLTKGDDASITVPLKTDAGETYTLGENEYLIFSVREDPVEESPLLLEVQSSPGSNVITLPHSVTDEVEVGYYSAEVQWMSGDGEKYTVWPKLTGAQKISKKNRKNFCVMTEVVYR